MQIAAESEFPRRGSLLPHDFSASKVVKVKQLIFDLDDTLLPSTYFYHEAERALRIDPALFKQAKKEVKRTLPKGSSQSHHRLLYFKRYLEIKGTWSVEATSGLYHHYIKEFQRALSRWKQKDAVADTLRQLKKHGYEIYVATNEVAVMQLVKLEFLSFGIDGLLTSEEVGVEKPSPGFFRELISRFAIKPKKAAFISDDCEKDLKPAGKLGFTTVWMNGYVSQKLPRGCRPDVTVQNLDQLYERIKNLN